MNSYVYSAKYNAFFPVVYIEQYLSKGWDLTDATDIGDELTTEFMADPPVGKVRVAGESGLPQWGNAPEPTQEEQIQNADLQKQQLIDSTNRFINGKQWPGKAAMGRLNESEKTQYIIWLDYLDALEAIVTDTAPDINWPSPPL